jgi:hypothetical protein
MDNNSQINYVIKQNFHVDCGFPVTALDIYHAILETSGLLCSLPVSLYRTIDYKATSGIIGAIFCDKLAPIVGAIVNPIEKGHPDIIPVQGQRASEQELRNYPQGLEVKTTIGNVRNGVNLSVGDTRIDYLTGITWQAHHREVDALLGIVWDFIDMNGADNVLYPSITGVFYSDRLTHKDWGKISGTTGRNTKVTGMTVSGKRKMGEGWIAIINDEKFLTRYTQIFGFDI